MHTSFVLTLFLGIVSANAQSNDLYLREPQPDVLANIQDTAGDTVSAAGNGISAITSAAVPLVTAIGSGAESLATDAASKWDTTISSAIVTAFSPKLTTDSSPISASAKPTGTAVASAGMWQCSTFVP